MYSAVMQNGRPLAKADRQRLIESIVSRKRVGTQFELIDALAAAGCVVTQATASRDTGPQALLASVATGAPPE